MNDKDFQKLINKTVATGLKYRELLNKSEEEYMSRYGNYPSEVDDDWWIDTMHQLTGDPDLSKIIDSAKEIINRREG